MGVYLSKPDGTVWLDFECDETRLAARCQEPAKAAELLNKARYLNDVKRQYTNAARAIYKAESLPGFEWVEQEVTP